MKETIEASRNIHQILIVICTIIGAFALSIKPNYILYEDALNELDLFYKNLDTVCVCRGNALKRSLESLKPFVENKYGLTISNTIIMGRFGQQVKRLPTQREYPISFVLAEFSDYLQPELKASTGTYSPNGFGGYEQQLLGSVSNRKYSYNLKSVANSLIVSDVPLKIIDTLLSDYNIYTNNKIKLPYRQIDLVYVFDRSDVIFDKAYIGLMVDSARLWYPTIKRNLTVVPETYFYYDPLDKCSYESIFRNTELWATPTLFRRSPFEKYSTINTNLKEINSAFLPNLKAVWSVVSELPYSRARVALIKLARRKEITDTVDVSGLKVATEMLYIIGPFIILVLLIYLLSLVNHIHLIYEIESAVLNTFPWLGLFPDVLSRIMSLISIVIFPIVVSWLAVWRSSITIDEKWMYTVVYGFTFSLVSGILLHKVFRLQDRIYPKVKPLSNEAEDEGSAHSF